MANKHAVVRTDLMHGTDVRAELMSVKYFASVEGDGEDAVSTLEAAEIENGNVVKVNDLLVIGQTADGVDILEREIFEAVDCEATDTLDDIALIASVEMMYDERKKNLDEFINEAGKACRAYRLHKGCIFSVTAEALKGTPEVGAEIAIAAGTKLEVGGSGTVIGKIIEEQKTSRYTYYAIKIK